MNAITTEHPLQKQIDEVVADVRSGEVTLSTVAWRLEQSLMSAEIEMQALAVLHQEPLIPAPVSSGAQVIVLIKKQIELAEQSRVKAAEKCRDGEDKATRIEARFDLQYYLGQKRALQTLLDAIEVRSLPIVVQG